METTEKIIHYLDANDILFENAQEEEKLPVQTLEVCTFEKPCYRKEQILSFCQQVLETPPQSNDIKFSSWKFSPFTHSSLAWVWQNSAGYFIIRYGGKILHFVDRRFY